jgi:hypothetical protein
MSYPPLSFNFRHPMRTSPRQPQNLPRPTAKGCGGPCGCAPCSAATTGTGFGRMGLGGLLGLGAVSSAYDEGRIPQGVWIGYSVLATVSAAASGYHGYKRNNSIGWAIVWFLLGGWFPIIVPVISVAQGFAKPYKK